MKINITPLSRTEDAKIELQCEADSVLEVPECLIRAEFRAEYFGGSSDLCAKHVDRFKKY